MPRPRSTSPVLAISLLALSRAAFAADPAPDAPAADPATEVVTVTALRHYVPTDNTTATKTDTPILETPQSISVVTQDELRLLHVQNLEQATRYTAGIVSGSYGADDRFDWLTLRGFQRPSIWMGCNCRAPCSPSRASTSTACSSLIS
jgi:iron complex outermembrane receptor protein